MRRPARAHDVIGPGAFRPAFIARVPGPGALAARPAFESVR